MNLSAKIQENRPVCVIAGVGPGNGLSFAHRFEVEGYAVALLARNHDYIAAIAKELPHSRAYPCDLTNAESIATTFAAIQADMGTVEVLVYNAGKGVWGTAEQMRAEDFEMAWRTNTFGAFQAAQQVIPSMKTSGKGSIIFIGATASRRGGVKTVAFASAKAAQRSLAESLARLLGPAGIHVSLLIVDGVIDIPAIRLEMPDQPSSFFIKPDDIADTVMMLTRQKSSAWTFELEVRPYCETW